MPEETAQQRYNRLQLEASKAFQEWQQVLYPPLGPNTEVWVTHTLSLIKKMTIKDLALQIRVPVSELIQRDSLKDAGAVVEKNSEWLHEESVEHWEAEEDGWSVTEVR